MKRYYFENGAICGNCNGAGLQGYMDYCRACDGTGIMSRSEYLRYSNDKIFASIEYNQSISELKR